MERKAQRLLNKYLVNVFHKYNKLMTKRGISGQLSVLQTVDEGSYLEEGKKDYPHFSNVIQPTDIPRQQPHIQRRIIKKYKPPHLFKYQDNIVIKIKQIYSIVTNIIQIGNEDFQPVGIKAGVSTKHVKLIYDLLSDFYKVERQLKSGRGQQSKRKFYKFIMEDLQIMMENYKNQQEQISGFIPFQQNFLSLAQLRQLLVKHFCDQ